MGEPGGYAGSILKVDLTSRSVTTMPLPEEIAVKFLGGAGINAWLAYQHIAPHTAPLSPGNALVFGAGPLVGTLAPGAGKTNFTSKSPLSQFVGTAGSGHMGGLKFTGHDHLVVTGKADSPVYLEIGDEVRIREAEHLWGKDTWETTDAIWHDLGRKYAVVSIGPAGENLVRDAIIIANRYSAYGKTGMGAVMGSKNLKAIAAYGSRGIRIAEPKRFMKLANELCREVMSLPLIQDFRTRGTLIALEDMIKGKTLSIPYKNSQQVADEESMSSFDIDALDRMTERHGNISCLACPVGCKHFMRLRSGLTMSMSCFAAPVTCFGGICAVEGWADLLKCCDLCNRLGIDYACASAIAMAIELYQRGIIDKEDTGGLELDWQPAVVHDLLQMIAFREGFGNVLADGLMEAPKHIGRGADYYALHYKGVGNSTGDPRPVFNSWVLSVLTNVIGHASGVKELYGMPVEKLGRSLRRMGISEEDLERVVSAASESNRAPLTRWTEDYSFALECLGLCAFDIYKSFDIDRWAQIYAAATGMEMKGAGLLEAAARGLDMRKAFNIREGASRKDDTMPKRFLTEPLKVGDQTRPPFSNERLDRLVTQYYEARGWDPQEGTLNAQRLSELTQ